jgi:hypothetical protein
LSTPLTALTTTNFGPSLSAAGALSAEVPPASQSTSPAIAVNARWCWSERSTMGVDSMSPEMVMLRTVGDGLGLGDGVGAPNAGAPSSSRAAANSPATTFTMVPLTMVPCMARPVSLRHLVPV